MSIIINNMAENIVFSVISNYNFFVCELANLILRIKSQILFAICMPDNEALRRKSERAEILCKNGISSEFLKECISPNCDKKRSVKYVKEGLNIYNRMITVAIDVIRLLKDRNINHRNSGDEKILIENKIIEFSINRKVGSGAFGTVYEAFIKKIPRFPIAIKQIRLSDISQNKHIKHLNNEQTILYNLSSPFIVKMYGSFVEQEYIYILMEYVCGGELYYHLRNMKKFDSAQIFFYSIEIACAIDYLHKKNVAFRDLKLENILLDRYGHIKLVDFGFSKKILGRTYTVCGTSEYLAPEIILGIGYDKSVDWWAYGILLYEMLCGNPPFQGITNRELYQEILMKKIELPKETDETLKNLIESLIDKNLHSRLGSTGFDVKPLNCWDGILNQKSSSVLNHKWFKNVSWKKCKEKKYLPPIIPKLNAVRGGPFNKYAKNEFNENFFNNF